MQTWLRAPRCFVDDPDLQTGRVCLSKEEGRHLSRVRRVGNGDWVSVLNGRGRVGQGPLELGEREAVSVEIQDLLDLPPIRPDITLIMGALKQSAWDELLKHVVELGVNGIIRVQSDHAVSDLKADKEVRKMQRWRECMIEACKQSANPWLPRLEVAGSVAEARERVSEVDLQLLASLEPDAQPLTTALKEHVPSRIALWVGPEGDFSERELRVISASAPGFSLGPRILRAETAGLALLSHLRLLTLPA